MKLSQRTIEVSNALTIVSNLNQDDSNVALQNMTDSKFSFKTLEVCIVLEFKFILYYIICKNLIDFIEIIKMYAYKTI